jgi:RNA polymerase sigma-70 factor, ECF subfamily
MFEIAREPPNPNDGPNTVEGAMPASNTKLSLVMAAENEQSLPDDVLMQRARLGSAPAFEHLVRRHQARVLRVAARYSSDASVAQDIAQSTFLELHRSLGRYEPRGHFTAYLCRIALNQCRIEGRRRQRSWLMLSVARSTEPALFDERPDLQRAIAELSSKLRDVVILRYSGDLDLAEIAEALDVPLGTVKRRLFDAMVKLRQSLGDEAC